jgi:hypothetical protein
MITFDELVESVCISLNDYLAKTRERVKNLIPMAVIHIISKHQWECTIRPIDLTCSASVDYVDLPDSFSKERALRRADYTKPIDYITPDKYNEMKALSSTPYGVEAVKYTIMGGDSLTQKRIHFLDPPISALTIIMLYNVKVDPNGIQDLPEEFIPTIKSYIIYQMTPPMLEVGGVKQYNPAFITARADYRKNLAELISYDQGQRGREYYSELDEVGQNANQYYHK